jgi:peptidoglycan-associated lipoprotein
MNHAHVKVRLEGNTDDRGTQEYNLALGERRAEAVKRYLEAQGVSAARISTVSFGKDNPLCNQNDESCWAKNRRVDFVYSGGYNGG